MSKSKSVTDIRAVARSYTEVALRTLTGVATNKDAPPSARVAAAACLLDRGWGRAPQDIHVKGQLEQHIIGLVTGLDTKEDTVPAATPVTSEGETIN